MPVAAAREYDLMVYGATGFTGKVRASYSGFVKDLTECVQLCSEYLAQGAGSGIKWAVAGRNRAKLEQVIKDIGAKNVAVEVAGTEDAELLAALAKRTRVVLAAVGPFAQHGEGMLRACIESGTHYVDLTGETPWVARMLEKYETKAKESGSIVIPSSGFDSVPSDLGTFYAIQALRKRFGDVPIGRVSGFVRPVGGVSGGTVASAVLAFKEEGLRMVTSSVYALSPVKGLGSATHFSHSATYKEKSLHGFLWTMERPNLSVVYRTWGLLETKKGKPGVASPYGGKFKYQEVYQAGSRLGAILRTGPTREKQEKGSFKLVTIAKSEDGKHEILTRLTGKGDPGYSGTAKMITESALALVHDCDKLSSLAKEGGFLTPVTGLGQVLIDRLEKTNFFTFTIVEDVKSK